MKKYKILSIILLLLLIISCSTRGDDVDKKSFKEKITRAILYWFRSGRPFFLSKKGRLAKELYNALWGVGKDDVKLVKELLEDGADPDYCRGECGWSDSNPLNVVAESFYNTYKRLKYGESIPDPAPDVVVFNLLMKAGADINKRPYIWNRIHILDTTLFTRIYNDESIKPETRKKQLEYYIKDSNRLIEAFLKAGADPDMLGHPYPYSYEGMKARITDEEAKEYFAKGSRAINVAIEKGIIWESQVDLLLQYTKLDEESLKAAERSNDPKMIEKISKLWEEHNTDEH
ncbi:MAG: hypothetical protein K8S14_01145 [Actinomycetia bacterium]|nr:hypothetical protein [Actinomycetes bacterium]